MDEVIKARIEPASTSPSENLQSSVVDELYRFAVTNFRKLDGDHNGYISADELNTIVKNNIFSGDDAKKVQALRDHVDDIAKLNDDGLFTGSHGISSADLVKLDYLWDKRNTNVGYAKQISEFGLRNFQKLDFGNHGQLMGYELVAENGEGCFAPQKHSIVSNMSAIDQQSFSLLHRNMSYIGHGQAIPNGIWMCKPYQYTTQYGITRDELAAYPAAVSNRPQYGLVNRLEARLSQI